MLNHTWKDNYVAREMRAAALERAATRREENSLRAQRGETSGLASWMVALGARMEVWGCRLQARYERVLQQQAGAAGNRLQLIGDASIQHNC